MLNLDLSHLYAETHHSKKGLLQNKLILVSEPGKVPLQENETLPEGLLPPCQQLIL